MPINKDDKSELVITVCKSITDFQIAKGITNNYIDWLGIDLGFQHVDDELQGFEIMYNEPVGCFLIAKRNGSTVGGVGCRNLERGICEMKRLYVYEGFQGLGVGRILCNEVISIAKQLGYQKMRLDTVAKLENANRLYEKIGFKDIPAYYANPEDTVRYMELDLV
jgi:putative acetyltransferase